LQFTSLPYNEVAQMSSDNVLKEKKKRDDSMSLAKDIYVEALDMYWMIYRQSQS
jgi:hypothetical protein